MSKTEAEPDGQKLELEKMLSQLMVSALELPPGAEKRDSLILIGRFRERIAAEVDKPTHCRRQVVKGMLSGGELRASISVPHQIRSCQR